MNASLFQRILGAEYFQLSPEVKALHLKQGRFNYAGRVNVERGKGALSKICGKFARLAPEMRDAPITVEFLTSPVREVWRRDFDGSPLVSNLSLKDGQLRERVGLITFRFRLYRLAKELHWEGERARAGYFCLCQMRGWKAYVARNRVETDDTNSSWWMRNCLGLDSW